MAIVLRIQTHGLDCKVLNLHVHVSKMLRPTDPFILNLHWCEIFAIEAKIIIIIIIVYVNTTYYTIM